MRHMASTIILLVLGSAATLAVAAGPKNLPITTIGVTDAPVTLEAFRGAARQREFGGLTLDVRNTSNRPIYSVRYLVSIDVTGLEFPVGMLTSWGDPRFDVETVAAAADQPALAPGTTARLSVPAAQVRALRAYLAASPEAEIRSVTVQPDSVGFGDGEGWVAGYYFDRKTMGPILDDSPEEAGKVALPCTKSWFYTPPIIQCHCEGQDRPYALWSDPLPRNRRENRTCFLGPPYVPGTVCTFSVIVTNCS